MIFKNKYNVQEKICETSNSLIYRAYYPNKENSIIIKVEKDSKCNYLLNETKIRKFLEGTYGISPLFDYGLYQNKRYIVYPYMEKTLYKYWMNRQQLYKCAIQMLKILQDIHRQGVVHCDISVTNIMYNESQKQFYLNDFGQAQRFSYALKERRFEKLRGCPMFCSNHVHEGKDFSPRDDLISLAFVLVYCFTKELPWSGLKNCKEVYEKKQQFKENFWNREIPHDLKIYVNYCFHLGINEKPNYKMLRELFLEEETTSHNQIVIGT